MQGEMQVCFESVHLNLHFAYCPAPRAWASVQQLQSGEAEDSVPLSALVPELIVVSAPSST